MEKEQKGNGDEYTRAELAEHIDFVIWTLEAIHEELKERIQKKRIPPKIR